MAMDTRNKRASAMAVGLPWLTQGPAPDGTLGTQDLRQVDGYYAWGLAVELVPTGGITFAGAAPLAVEFVFAPSGGLAFAGVAPVLIEVVFVTTGGITFAGHAPELVVRVYPAPTGGLSFGGAASIDFTNVSVLLGKTFVVHVYASNGTTLLSLWQPADLPRFVWPIDAGPGSMILKLSRQWAAAGEKGETGSLNDLEFGNVVKVYVVDRESGESGQLLYRGVIDDYEQTLDGQMVSVALLPRSTYWKSRSLIEDVVFAATDPTAMAQYFVTNNYLPGVTWDGASPLVGNVFNYTFKQPISLDQVFSLLQTLAGGNWYWRLNIDDSLTFNYWNIHTAPDHTLVIGKHVSRNVKIRKSRLNYYQRIIVTGQVTTTADTPEGGTTETTAPFTVYVDQPGYDPTVEPRDFRYSNTRINEAAAALAIGGALLEYYNVPFYETTFTVIDNNIDSLNGYDIESLKPGQTVSLVNPDLVFQPRKWGDLHIWGDGGYWGGTRVEQIQRPWAIAQVDYQGDRAILTLRNRPVDVPAQLVDIDNRLQLVGG